MAAAPDTRAILKSHPDLMFDVLQAGVCTPPAAKRRKTGN